MMHRLHPIFIDNKILWRRYLEVIDFNNNVCETANLSHKPTELIFYANRKQKTCINNVRILCYLFYKLLFYFSAERRMWFLGAKINYTLRFYFLDLNFNNIQVTFTTYWKYSTNITIFKSRIYNFKNALNFAKT